jgi:hypothetical protein
MDKIIIGFVVGLAAGVGIGLAVWGNPLFALLTIPAVLFVGWNIANLYQLSHWNRERFKRSMWH